MLTRTIAMFSLALAAVVFGASQTDAQPGKSPSKEPAAASDVQKTEKDLQLRKEVARLASALQGSDVQKLEKELQRLLEQVKDTKAKLAQAKEAGKGKPGFEGKGKGGFEGKGKRKSGFEGKGKGKGGFDGKKKDGKKEFGKGPPFGGKGGPGAMFDPETIKQKYYFYKELYERLPSKGSKGKAGFGGGFGGFGGFGPKGFEGMKKEASPPSRGGFGGGAGGAAGSSSSLEARIDRVIRELEQLRNEVKARKK